MATGSKDECLIAFKSGHYKKITGEWVGDSVWAHFKKVGGGMVHINKAEVEYMETFDPLPPKESGEMCESRSPALHFGHVQEMQGEDKA